MTLKNAKIRTKLIALVTISLIFLGVVAGTAYYSMDKMDRYSEDVFDYSLQPIIWQGQIRTNNRAIDSFILEILLDKEYDLKEERRLDIIESEEETHEYVEKLENILLSDEQVANLQEFKKANQEYIEGLGQVIDLAFADKQDEGYALFLSDVQESRRVANAYMRDIEVYLEEYADNLNDEITESNNVSSAIIIAIFVLSLIVEVVVAIIIIRMIVSPIQEVKTLMSAAEDGDLTVEGTYTSEDELGQLMNSFNQMMSRLRGLMRQVNGISEQVAASSQELTASAEQTTEATNEITISIQQVAEGAEAQERGAAESSLAINEMSIGIQQIAESTSSVSELALETNQGANQGFESLKKVIEQMDTINSSVNQSATVVQELRVSSNQIGKIIEVITTIADQTNLLALNAAIEAARAGEHGQGFSVVAEEVRTLAEQSKQSADQITVLIHKIQEDTSQAVDVMHQGTEEVKTGVIVVNEAEESFKTILHNIDLVSARIQETSAVSEEMSASVEQVNASIEEIAQVSQVSAGNTLTVASASEEQLASMEEITSASVSLSKIAEELQSNVSQFRV